MKKWFTLSAMAAGATLFQLNGCLNSYWQGFWNDGWPEQRWLNIAIDVVNEAVFG